MGIPTNYSELLTEVSNWLKRDDLDDDVATFVAFAEAKINKISRLSDQEVQASVVTTPGQFYTSVPAGFLDHISLTYDGDLYDPPEKVTIGVLDRYKDQTTQSTPTHFAISKSKYWWNFQPDSAYNLTARFWKKWNIANDDTNWILENYPDAYLYGALVHGTRFIRHPNKAEWQAFAQEALDDIEYESSKQRKANLMVDPGLQVRAKQDHYNIYSDN